MKPRSILLISALLLASFSIARSNPEAGADAAPRSASAAVLRQAAEDQAAKEGKAVFLEFHASWCIWCKRLHAMLDDPQVKPVWDRYFVTTEIDSMERSDKLQLENPGWEGL